MRGGAATKSNKDLECNIVDTYFHTSVRTSSTPTNKLGFPPVWEKKSSRQELETERASKSNLWQENSWDQRIISFPPLQLASVWGGGGGKGGHIFSETKTLSIGIRYGFEALRALIGGMDGVRICWWGTRNWGLWAGTRVSDDAQDVGLLPAMMFLIVWPLCARKIWDAI